jgi:serine/threonine-protein kinase
VTARCDQYSLGGVMYALLAGRPPFRAKNLPQMLQLQRFAEPEPVRRYAPDTPEQLEQVISQLLAKDPADRFPNMQVLARHLQAMVMALSRPAADDFALATDQPGDQHLPENGGSLADEPTRDGSLLAQPRGGRGPGGIAPSNVTGASQDAVTLAAEESRAQQAPLSVAASTAPNIPPTAAIERPTRFTTLEEEAARHQAEHRRSWLVGAAQWAALLAVIGAMISAVLYVSRPPSADKLYASISAQVDTDDDVSLALVEREINDFLTRFPDDPRSDILRTYEERIELGRLERKLRRQKTGGVPADASLLPVERAYLRASLLAESSPEAALNMWASLIDLYGPAVLPDDASAGATQEEREAAARTASVVQLARRRIESLRADVAKQQEHELASLKERLAAATRLTKTSPDQAASMYRAIIDLHAEDAWAKTVVDDARARLEELKK